MAQQTRDEKKRIRDPIHDFITFDTGDDLEKILWNLLQTRPFQRLRRIKQLGFSDFVYPGATHTRFSHSLGALHIAKKLIRAVDKKWEGASSGKKRKIETALVAALLHDIGHGPFSHAFENACKEITTIKEALIKDTSEEGKENPKIHEALTQRIVTKTDEIKRAIEFMGLEIGDVIKYIMGESESEYAVVVSSQFDADRLDYMQRDRYMTGTQQGGIDFGWLMDNLKVVPSPQGEDEDEDLRPKNVFALDEKALEATESYVIALFQLYPTVYFHKATRSAEILFSALLKELFNDISNNESYHGLPSNHPLVKFVKNPECLDNYLSLDDTVIWGALPILKEEGSGFVKEAAGRLLYRNLYKVRDVSREIEARAREWIEEKEKKLIEEEIKKWIEGRATSSKKSIDKEKAIKSFFEDVGDELKKFAQSHNQSNKDKIFIDVGARDSYKYESDTPIYIVDKEDGSTKNITDLSEIIKAAPVFQFIRIYAADRDNSAIDRILSKSIEKSK